MKPPRFPATFALVLLFFSASFVFGDANPAAGRKACVFPIDDVSESGDYGDFGAILTNSVSLELRNAGFEILAVKDVKEPDLMDGQVAMRVALEAGADMAVNGFYAADGKQILISVQAYDAVGDIPIAGFMKTLPLNVTFYNALHGEIAQLVTTVHFAKGKALTISEGTAKVTLAKVTFLSSNEGMEVRLAGGESIGVIAGGRLDHDLGGVIAGTALLVEKRLAGYHAAQETVRAGAEIPLAPLAHASDFGLQVDWTMGQLMGLGVAFRWYMAPDMVFTSVGTYVSAQPPMTSAGRFVLHDDTTVLVGAYLSPPEAGLRFGISAGLGMVLSVFTQPGFPVYTDIYLSPFNAWMEWTLLGARMSLGIEGRYATGLFTNLLGRGWMLWEVFPPVTLGVLFKW